ncbi:hypothetical protein E4P24_02815 [Haloferax sp. AS1]|uniref:hypothetical protein n=1 Tax=Haloferax sp. AS1 TaxID=2562277 RepID=UPI00165FBAD7|nr:hypothetical protein [Haloferax sp. AS1]MBC9985303.1 hypothetical protein [Haloferax sp. AS1]
MVDWQRGEPQPSLRDRIVQLLKDNPEKIWTPAEVRGEIYPEIEWPSSDEMSTEEQTYQLIGVAQKNAVAHYTMETLVDEGILEKREFRIDKIAEVTINEDEYEQVRERLPDDVDVYEDRIYYRLNKDSL